MALALVVLACGESNAEDPAETTTSPASSDPPATSTTVEGSGAVPELTLSTAPDWQVTALGRGVKPALDLDEDDLPAVAWILERRGGFIAFASLADSWDQETVFEGYFYGPIDLAFDPENRPNIVIHDHQADTFREELGDLVRLTRSDSGWAVDTAESPGHDGWDSTVEISEDGVVHAAGVDPSQFGRVEGVEYYRNEGDGWDVTQVGSGPIPYQYNVSLALSPSGSPALTYYNDSEMDLIYAVLDGSDWQFELVDAQGDVGKFSSLAFDAEGQPHVTYFSQASPSQGAIVYATRMGERWTAETVGRIEAFSEPNARRNSAIDFDVSGNPHVVFSDTSGVWYSTRSEDGWETRMIVEAGSGPLGQLVSFQLDDDDTPHIALYEVTNEAELDGLVAYLTTG